MKCDACHKEIEETFLGKLKGTVVKSVENNRTKDYHVCSDCQKKYKDIKSVISNR